MSLLSLGKNAVFVDDVRHAEQVVATTVDATGNDDAAKAKEKLNEIKKDIQTALTPWIPGDFIVAYGTLLTAWSSLSRSFFALAVIALISSVAFVWLGAFAATGLKNPTRTVRRRLLARTAVGWPLSIFVALTIPASGWNDFKWYRDNEAPVILTAGLVTGLLVLVLKGALIRGWIQQNPA